MNYSRRQLYALGEPIGDSATRLKLGGRVYGGGGGGGGGQPSSTTQTTELPEWARPYAKDIMARGAALTDVNQNPYQQYKGNRIAGFTPMQQQAFTGAANMTTADQLGTGTDLAKSAGIGALNTNYQAGQFSGGQFDQAAADAYMNPYQQNVIDIGKREAARQSNLMGTQQAGQATSAGAFGGSRFGIQQAERERNLGQQMSDIQTQGSNTAYTNAQQQFNADQARRMQAQQLGEQSRQYGAGLGMQGFQTALQSAGQLGQLGSQQFQQGMDINKLQSAYGGQMQQQAQRPLDMAYQDFLNQQNYPYKQLGYFSDLVRGLPLGQKSTSSMYEQGPSTLQTVTGLSGAAYGFGKSGLFAEGGEVKTYAGDKGSVTSQDNKDSIVEGMYSITGLQKAREAALNRRDLDTVQAIDERLGELNSIKQAESASLSRGLGNAFDQIPQERQEQMMAGGGIVAFAPGGVTYKKQSEDALTGLNDLLGRYPTPQTAEEYEGAVTKRLPMVEKIYGPDVTKPYLEETKAKREKLSEQLGKDTGLAFAMSSLGMLARKAKPGESRKTQLISGLGEAGQQFAGEVGRLRKDSREADDRLRQSEVTLATAQQARREGLVGKAMGLEDKSRAEALDGYKTHLGVAKDVAQLASGLAGHEMSAEASKYAADQGLKGHMASAAASLKGHELTAGKPSALKEGTDVYYAKLRPMYLDKSDADVRAMAQQKYLEQTKTGMPGVEAKIAATAEEKARERAAGRMTTDPVALKAAREKDASALSARRQEILREELARPPEQELGAAAAAQATPNAPAQQPAAVNIPPQAVDMLKQNPTADNRRYFDQTFGAGAAARVLGK